MSNVEDLDQQDRDILSLRIAARDRFEGPRVGDFVQFADRARPVRRFAHEWGDDWPRPGMQTADGGTFYLPNAGPVQFSGALYPSVPFETLTLTDQVMEGHVWFFHHNHPTAGGGVTVYIPQRVYLCSLPTNH